MFELNSDWFCKCRFGKEEGCESRRIKLGPWHGRKASVGIEEKH